MDAGGGGAMTATAENAECALLCVMSEHAHRGCFFHAEETRLSPLVYRRVT